MPSVQLRHIIFFVVVLWCLVKAGSVLAVIGPSNPSFGPPPGWITPPDLVVPPPPVLNPPSNPTVPTVPAPAAGQPESAASRERADYLKYRTLIWDLAFQAQQATGVPASRGAEYLDLLFNAQRPGRDEPDPPELESPADTGMDRPPIPGTRKKGEWPTCWVNNPPKTPWLGGMNSDGTPEIISGVFAGRCDDIVWETGGYACLVYRSSLGGPWRIPGGYHGCDAEQRKGSDRVTLNVTVSLCKQLRRQAPIEWRVTGHVWVNYAPPGFFAGSFYRSRTYSSESIVIGYRPCQEAG